MVWWLIREPRDQVADGEGHVHEAEDDEGGRPGQGEDEVGRPEVQPPRDADLAVEAADFIAR